MGDKGFALGGLGFPLGEIRPKAVKFQHSLSAREEFPFASEISSQMTCLNIGR